MNCSALGNAPLRLAGVLIGRRLVQRSAAGVRRAEKALVLHALAVVPAQFAALAEEDPPGQAVAGLAQAGRGLLIVVSLTSQWGYAKTSPAGKTVWARILAPSR